MAMKIYGIYVKGAEIPEKIIQVKRKDMAEKCIAEYIRIGSLPYREDYEVRKLAAEKS